MIGGEGKRAEGERLSDLSHVYESYERMAASPRVFLLWIQRQLPIENFLAK
jgi:hypothetical protein